jgi:type IV pilus assembly protein PilO
MIDLKTMTPEKIKESLKAMMPDKVKEFLSDEQSRIYVFLGSIAVFALLYLTFAIVPRFYELSKASREVTDINNAINQVNERAKRLDKTTEQLKSSRMELESYSRGLPDQKGVPEFLERLSSIARTSDVRILSITPSELKAVKAEGKSSGFYREMPIIITAKSGYHQLGSFVSNLEKEERFITIEDLRIQYDSKFPRKHNISMVLKTYVALEPEKK